MWQQIAFRPSTKVLPALILTAFPTIAWWDLILLSVYAWADFVFYFLGVAQVVPVIQLLRAVGGFDVVRIHVWLGASLGFSDYGAANIMSILSPVIKMTHLEIGTIIVWIGMPAVLSLPPVRSLSVKLRGKIALVRLLNHQ